MPRIRQQLSPNDKSLNTDDIVPVKIKSKPGWHFCYVCREYIWCPSEDFYASGHFDLNKVTELAGKSAYHSAVYAECKLPPNKPKPRHSPVEVLK